MKVVLVLIFLVKIVFAYCAPVPCSPEASSGQSQISSNISSIDSKIKNELDKKKEYLSQEKALLEEITLLQDEILSLSKRKSVFIDMVIQEDSNIKEIIRIQR